MKDLVIIVAALVAYVLLRKLINLLVRAFFDNFLITSARKVRMVIPMDIFFRLSCAGITAYFLFDKSWLLYLGMCSGILMILAFLFMFYQAKREPGTLMDFVENYHKQTGKPMSESLKRQIQKSREAKNAPAMAPVESVPAQPAVTPERSPEAEARDFAAHIPEHAERHRQLAKDRFHLDLNYDADSMAALDRMIQEGWSGKPPAMLQVVVIGFGSYLGETIRHIHGGDWCYSDEHGLHFQIARLRPQNLFQFAIVEKRFTTPGENSLDAYYKSVRSEIDKHR